MCISVHLSELGCGEPITVPITFVKVDQGGYNEVLMGFDGYGTSPVLLIHFKQSWEIIEVSANDFNRRLLHLFCDFFL